MAELDASEFGKNMKYYSFALVFFFFFFNMVSFQVQWNVVLKQFNSSIFLDELKDIKHQINRHVPTP